MIASFPAMLLLHAGCAAVYLVVAVLVLARGPRGATAWWLAFACLATAFWAAAVTVQWRTPAIGVPGWLELARSAAWYGFILHVYRRSVPEAVHKGRVFMIIGLVILMAVTGLPLLNAVGADSPTALWSVRIVLGLGIPVCAILLLENLYFNTPVDARWHINLLCVALGAVFVFDMLLYADSILFRRISPSLLEARAPVVAIAAPLLAIAAARNRRWRIDIHVSRDVVFHGASLIIAGIFLLALATAGEVVRRDAAQWGHVAESALIFGGMMVVVVLLTSGSVRSRLRALVTEHFFSYRYDYRREWMRCIETLTTPDAHVGLHLRAIRAAANVVDSPAGVLFVRAPDEVAFHWAGSWNLPAVTEAIPPGHPIVPAFRDGDWIVVLDEIAGTETWFPDLPRAWVAVPLNHFGTLIGFVVLARARAQFKLDREAYDLLRVVGREIASRVAEQRAAQVLAQTRELREYSQRFAFVIHDIKNVSGQLTMLLSNAEVHADNPAFQRDMLTTVRASVAKISRLLTRLQADRHERAHALIAPADRLRALVDNLPATAHGRVTLVDHSRGAGVAIDPENFDAIILHLLNNAIESTGPDGMVTVSIQPEARHLSIDIADQGPGMAPEFVRDALFRPFASTKDGGHGIGAYQARELLREAGGDLLVHSREGEGTTMRLLLPAVHAVAAYADPTPV
jgi:putative PEP-CTERM system histidine kinase